MLNIINLLKKNKVNIIYNKKGDTTRVHRRYIPLSKEWYNSIYSFSKNPIRFLPAVHSFIFKLFKTHFNIINKRSEIKIKSRRFKKSKRLSGNKVWVSTPEIKHFNKEIIITIYIYNRLYNFYKAKLNFAELSWGPKIEQENNNFILENRRHSLIIPMRRKLRRLNSKYKIYWGTRKKVNSATENYYVSIIKWLKWDKYVNIEQDDKLNISKLKKNKLNFFKNLNMLKVKRYSYLINLFKKELMYIKLRQKILFNKFKFNELYTKIVIKFLEIIYKKNILLNIVILKNYYLSSSILSQIIVSKTKTLRNRGKSARSINKALEPTRTPNLSSGKIPRIEKTSIGMQNTILDKFKLLNTEQDSLNEFLLINNKNSKIWSSKYIDKLALTNLENKSVAGVFIKISGRLTKRYKAQRAIKNLRYKGTLRNVYSAYKGFSSTLSKGYSNINIEKTMISSKVRIGAFGLTGWVASC